MSLYYITNLILLQNDIKSCMRMFFRQYAAIVFVANNRFETTKKKLSYLTFDDFVFCANQMITNWSYSSKGWYDHHVDRK